MAEDTPAAAAPAPAASPAAVPAAPVAVLSDAPIAAAPVESPVAVEAAVAETPAVESAPVEAPAAEPAAAPVADAPPVDPAKPADAAPPEAPAVIEPPKYAEVLKTPEGLTIAPEQMTAYADLLGKHNLPPEVGQELMDFGSQIIKSAEERLVQNQHDVFAETRRGWVSDAQKQFGNRFDTTVNDAKFAISQVVGDKKERAALWNVLAFTGAGDHPAVIGAWAKVGKILRERAAPGPSVPQNGSKTANPADRRYGGPKN